jgi:hypothetical protein
MFQARVWKPKVQSIKGGSSTRHLCVGEVLSLSVGGNTLTERVSERSAEDIVGT